MVKETNPNRDQSTTIQSTSFSPDGRYFAALSPESTLKVWDTSSGEIVADWTDTESAAVYSCIACSNGRKKRKKENFLLVALGTATGDVLAVDVIASKKIWTNRSFHSGEVVSLHFSKNGNLIYTAGADGVMYALHSETGEAKSKFKASKKRINSLSISHDERFVGVASKISQIIGLDSNTELAKIPSDHGHAQLISLSDKNAFCSYGSGEIHVYNFDPENKTIKINTTLQMKNAPTMLECNSNLVLSVSDKGIVYVWNIEQDAGVGSMSSTIKIKSEKRKKKGRTDGEMGKIDSQKEKVKKRAAPDSNSENEETVEKAHESGVEFNSDEPTMGEKLASLDLAIGEKEKEKVERDKSLTASFANPPSADSVHVLIRQALHADDQSLLLDCVYTRDEKVIAKSISLLTPADVMKLMKFFVLMIQSRGAIVACVIPWLRCLINLKASSIVSHDSSLSLLNSLYQLIDSRVATFGSALKLSTCIDYHFSGIDEDEAEEEAPPVIYEDKDSDEEEEASEDAMETDEEEPGNVIDAPQFSDGSEVMSD
ncbi:WD40 repeat-containing SMU1 [Carex littledalei]|uniref:WD40 repeat-containing SMU1 n=1 Tax=Carex littledalei TaxID=544730 RepID=A0A833VMA3_9POAL|nr:WD40 repeat-containing SMU1 [Carex littledalei]